MLKPVDPGPQPPERPVGELVHQLIEEGKAYARAELDLLKAIGTEKARAFALPAILFGAALICALAAVTALAVGVVIALAQIDRTARRGVGGDVAVCRHRRRARLVRRRAIEARAVTDSAEVAVARLAVERSRARLMGTAQELQDRLSPKTLAKGAWQGAKEKGADIAEDAVDAVKARPFAASGVVAAITMFLAREPLWDLATKIAGGVSDKRKTRKRRKTAARPDKTETVE